MGTDSSVTEEGRRHRNRQIQAMFGRIVPRYDRMNRLMSFGMDGGWRRMAATAAEPRGMRVLDLGTGTGDLARELTFHGAACVVGADFSPAMLSVAASRYAAIPINAWVAADGHHLPFADATFDCLTNAFVLRNLVNLPAAFREMTRVLRPGGRLVCLDITQPPHGIFSAMYRLYFNHIMPPLAGLLSGDRAAYRYLPNSLTGFPDADRLSDMLRDAGAQNVRCRRLAAGAVALHVADRAPAIRS
ncbi:MAG TPA: bifunctional demethylmenaquinone methyltransferase/2-methoxy-6-polyprenyl-1,4-benzoquinol methylase UbiE [Dehalococcoidia bacterium]|nr:bifunctional demethylmenaquinone methyltransferase/2-methoxy-6-polyprenyl-1,4-benzoquinol methylase UbiE [Dehalococcoidia bacterium]